MTPAAATSTCRAASAWAAASRRRDVASCLGPSEGPSPPATGLRRRSRLRPNAITALIATALVVSGCHVFDRPATMHAAAPAGTWHVVAPGENLETIARRA